MRKRRRKCLTLLLGMVLSLGCERMPVIGDDLSEAKLAAQNHDWTLAERLLERYLRQQHDNNKRWEAWQFLVDVNNRAGHTHIHTVKDFKHFVLHTSATVNLLFISVH